jgi:cytochrome c oxidase cbb3-type subunit 2
MEAAESALKKTLALEPRHELAHRLLAELLEEQQRLDESLRQYRSWIDAFPSAGQAVIGIARLNRKTGDLNQARTILCTVNAPDVESPEFAEEMGHVELESGNYSNAIQWLSKLTSVAKSRRDLINDIATAISLNGKPSYAHQLFVQSDILLDLEHNADGTGERSKNKSKVTTDEILVSEILHELHNLPSHEMSGTQLYEKHCSACHGTDGDGRGRASASLSPRPWNFMTGEFRLVSTENRVASLDDLINTIRSGIPGTSMQSFDHFDDDTVRMLALEVQKISRSGVESKVREVMSELDQEASEATIAAVVTDKTTPGENLNVPLVGTTNTESIHRGRSIYLQLGCQNCHGDDGAGPAIEPLVGLGRYSRIRDLTKDPFKGGHQSDSIYKRVSLGMPGTIHPASTTIPPDKLVDLVHYIQSLAVEPKNRHTNFQRANQLLDRTLLPSFHQTTTGEVPSDASSSLAK